VGKQDYIYNFIRHIGSHIQYKKAMYSKQNDEKVNKCQSINQYSFIKAGQNAGQQHET